MLDAPLRRRLAPVLDRAGVVLARRGVRPLTLTVLGLLVALAAAAAAALAVFPLAAALWLLSRVPDGLDGPVARAGGTDSAFGGWADLTADMVAYGSFVVGCAIGQPEAATACLVLLLTYYVNGGSLLAYSAAAERAGVDAPDRRTFHFTPGLAEGTETIVVHTAMVLFPAAMAPIAWVFALAVLVTIGQRLRLARRVLADT
ncbi:MAG: CDP-alcohol phosphatidyltransferase family protein [Actinomycetota bacterium]